MRLSTFKRHPREELSSYLDGELIPVRTEAMQAHLASCPSCRAELEALRELKAGLTTMPEITVPRSFALTPEMIVRPVSERERPAVPARARAMASGMRLAGAGMTLVLVLVLVLDSTGSGTKGGGSSTAANVQQFAAQNSDSSSAASGNVTAPTPAPAHNDLRSSPASFPTGAPLPGSIAGIPATPGIAPAPVGGEPSPAIVQTDGSPPVDKSVYGTAESSPTSAPAALNAQPSVSGGQQPAAAPVGSGGGVDVLLIVALALAAAIVLTVAASFVLPRLGGDDV
jgi:hypothetical protein